MTRGMGIDRPTRPTRSPPGPGSRLTHETKSNVWYSASTARATPWNSRTQARRTEVIWTGTNERFRTRLFVWSTPAVAGLPPAGAESTEPAAPSAVIEIRASLSSTFS